MLPLGARVDIAAMEIKGYSAFLKVPVLLERHHQICHIQDNHYVGVCWEAMSVFYSPNWLGNVSLGEACKPFTSLFLSKKNPIYVRYFTEFYLLQSNNKLSISVFVSPWEWTVKMYGSGGNDFSTGAALLPTHLIAFINSQPMYIR